MPLRRMPLIAAFLLASALSATAQKTAIPVAADTQDNPVQQKRDALGCEGAFARDTTHAKLVAAFGAKNVAFKEVDAAEGSKGRATVLFDDDPTKRIVVFWHDEKRTRPSMIKVSAPSLWVGPGGIGNGMKLTDVEKLNGKPFKLAGFDWDGGGLVRELDGKLKPSALQSRHPLRARHRQPAAAALRRDHRRQDHRLQQQPVAPNPRAGQ